MGTRGGNAYDPYRQLLLDLDYLHVSANALRLGYHAPDADPLEDACADWKGRLLRLLAAKYEPHWLPVIERVGRLRREADARCDRTVNGHTGEMQETLTHAGEQTRRLHARQQHETTASTGRDVLTAA